MFKKKVLFEDDFNNHKIGALEYDYSPIGEYHYYKNKIKKNGWIEPSNRGWRLGGHWIVIENENEHYLMQPTNTQHEYKLINGNVIYDNYELSSQIRPLNLSSKVGYIICYKDNFNFYSIVLDRQYLLLCKNSNDKIKLIKKVKFSYTCDNFINFNIKIQQNLITIKLNNKIKIKNIKVNSAAGKFGLIAESPCYFNNIKVLTTDKNLKELNKIIRNEKIRIKKKSLEYPQPHLIKKISLKNFGAGRQIRIGDLTGNGTNDFIIAQNIKLNGIDLYSSISCLTAIDHNGKVLWQFGEPSSNFENQITTSDLPFQIYDIDGDGYNEVILAKNFFIYILDGKTGKIKNKKLTPMLPNNANKNYTKWPENDYYRINGDSIIICNFSGNKHPSDILIKNRYNFIWALDKNLNQIWTKKLNTGHFPQPFDFNEDGIDELIAGYSMISGRGKKLFDLNLPDHVDEIAIGKFDTTNKLFQIAVTAGDEGLVIFDQKGKIISKNYVGHAQRLCAGKFRKDINGYQFYVVTFWNGPNIISLHDSKGKKIFSKEKISNGNLLCPVNWNNQECDLVLLNGNVNDGGLIDGFGDTVVNFPDDGHPDLCALAYDFYNLGHDQIILWDQNSLYIYSHKAKNINKKSKKRYPIYNYSNYRGEISL
ncbi:hypothetical protein OAI01_07795 [Alphaproteobacteria bacterium]|nr:hypothetical protein [Alphaproteobacteria bacterium]